MSSLKEKDPNATKDYFVDWAGWLDGDTITASTWVVPTGLTQGTASYTSTRATVWLSGGTSGSTYDVTNHITTTGGRQDERTLHIRCIEQ